MDIGFTLQKALKELKTQRWSKLDFSGAKMAKITLKMHDTEFFHLISYVNCTMDIPHLTG